MKNTKWLVAVIAFVLCGQQLYSQNAWCGTVTKVQNDIKNDPEMAKRYHDYENTLRQLQLNSSSRADTTWETVYIPVVFHIVYNNAPLGVGENISDAQILSQIDALNRDFNYHGQYLPFMPQAFKPLVANCNIKFCMAQFDPDGNPTTGIVRHQISKVSWNSEKEIDSLLKPVTIWDNSLYLNIWSVNMAGELDHVQDVGAVLAYATLPPYQFKPSDDGVVARWYVVGTTGTLIPGNDQGKTISHEVGHWLGLHHTWGDDLGLCSTDVGGGTDFIDDTPDQADANFGCPVFPHVSCNNEPNGDLYMNFMDYTTDDCRGMFTPDQSRRMHEILGGYRHNLTLQPTACYYDMDATVLDPIVPAKISCSLSFTPTFFLQNKGLTTLTSGTFHIRMDNGAEQTQAWTGTMTSGDKRKIFLPQQTVSTGNHTLSIAFSNPNELGSDYNLHNDTLTIAFSAYDGGNAAPAPFAEGFEGSFPENNWSIINPDNDTLTWKLNHNCGAYGQSSSCLSMNNKAYTSKPKNKKDAVVTTSYDFTNVQYPDLTFDLASRRVNASRGDTLTVYYSTDCDSTWIRLWSQAAVQLSTGTDTIPIYIPRPNQWKTVNIPLLNLTGLSKVSFKFENASGWGNMLYLDNINLLDNPSLALAVKDLPKTEDVKIYPNPSSNLVGVRLPANHSFKKLQLFNRVGQLVYETTITDSAIVFPIDNFAAGLYLVHLTGDKMTQTEKLVIAR